MPRVSVILSAFNAAKTVDHTLTSLFRSKMTDWEAVIVNDASQDETGDKLEAFSRHDPRIHVLHNSENLGLAASLNRAIDTAQSPYLARLDADDILLPDRFIRQTTFLDAHPDVGALGMGAWTIDSAGQSLGYKSPLPTVVIPWAKLWRVPFIHPTVMLRREILDEHELRYDSTCRVAQDFEFWSRLLTVTQGSNLNSPGICYRVHSGQATKNKINQRLDAHRNVSRKQLSAVSKMYISDSMLEAQRGYFLGEAPRGEGVPDLFDALRWREMIAHEMLLQSAREPIDLGLGFDLWHLVRHYGNVNVYRRILGNCIRRKQLMASLPLLVKQRAIPRLWKYLS